MESIVNKCETLEGVGSEAQCQGEIIFQSCHCWGMLCVCPNFVYQTNDLLLLKFLMPVSLREASGLLDICFSVVLQSCFCLVAEHFFSSNLVASHPCPQDTQTSMYTLWWPYCSCGMGNTKSAKRWENHRTAAVRRYLWIVPSATP